MAQHDYIIDNAPGATVRADINNALAAIATQNSGAGAPATPYAYQFWADTTSGKLKMRNAANSAWITVMDLASGDAPAADAAPDGSAFSLRNKIINGDFSVNQRGVSGTVTLAAGAYGHDRWKAGASGCTYTFAATNGVTTITITAGSLQQVIEDKNVPGGTNTLYMTWTGTAQGKIGAGSYGASGVSASVTGGANLTVEFGTGTLAKVQIEAGGVTPFEQRPYGLELSLCQRYYQQAGNAIVSGIATAGAQAVYQDLYYVVQMRAAPTVSIGTFSNTNSGNATFATGDSQHQRVYATSSAAGPFFSQYSWTAAAEL